MTREITFESPSFGKRIKGMLGVDFYRLFHTPLFYIFLAIAAIIPAAPPPTTATMFLFTVFYPYPFYKHDIHPMHAQAL